MISLNKIAVLFVLLLSQVGFAKAYPEFGSGCELGDSKIASIRNEVLDCMKNAGEHCAYFTMSKKCGLKELPKISDIFIVAMSCQSITPVSTVDAFYQPFGEACRDNPATGNGYYKQVKQFNITWDSKKWEAWKKTAPKDGQNRPMIITKSGTNLTFTQGQMFSPETQIREWIAKNL